METIYRIEDANHVGCYARGFVVCTTGDHHGPDNDPILGQWWKKDNLSRTKQSEWLIERKAWFCGFRSMDELHNWFSPSDLSIMARIVGSWREAEAVYITAYNVPKRYIKYGEEQIMFKREMATVCHRTPISVTEEA